MATTLDKWKAARRAAVPLVVIHTPDPNATILEILRETEKAPINRWDCITGVQPINQPARKLASWSSGGFETINPVQAIMAADERMPEMSILFMCNLHAFISSGDASAMEVIQALQNARDRMKNNKRTIAILCPSLTLPEELKHDAVVIREPLPNEQQIEEIAKVTLDAFPTFTAGGKIAGIVDATAGLSAFEAEQAIAMSVTPDGIDSEMLWENKRAAIEAAPGLKVWRGKEGFGSIGGYSAIKGFLQKLFSGSLKPRVIVFIDEIEKQLAGLAGDSSGVTQDQLGEILTFMEDERCSGILLLGPAGTGKSNISKAAGNEAGVPVIALNLGAMKHEHVGQSEARIRGALDVIRAIGQDKILFVATCNSVAVLPPELRRRFRLGSFFMDLPNKEERSAIWRLYGGSAKGIQEDGWTGAEIKQCCEYAQAFGCSEKEAAKYIVPVSVSAADVVKGLRQQASGRFLSASYPGLYQEKAASESVNGRSLSLGED